MQRGFVFAQRGGVVSVAIQRQRKLITVLRIAGLQPHGRAAVVEVPLGRGQLILFAINPIWRGETIGSYGLVFNAILNFDRLAPNP